jgi:membrane protein YdbS with pleckstrin-like domain
VGNIIYFLLWRKKYKFEFNPEFIYYRTGVIAINEQHMPYNTVQNVNVQQSIIDRIFNLSNVIIENAAQGQIVYRARGRGAVPFNRGIIIKGISLSDANHIAEVLRNILLTKNPQNTGL